MNVSIEDIKQLRAQTSASLADVKEALEKSEGDYDKALKFLFEKGLTSATKKMDRATGQGIVYSYVHNYRIGVLVEINCETDFVARNEEFVALGKDIAVQIVLENAKYVDSSEAEEGADKNEVLTSQKFYKNPEITVDEHIKHMIAKFGENIKIRRFVKLELGK